MLLALVVGGAGHAADDDSFRVVASTVDMAQLIDASAIVRDHDRVQYSTILILEPPRKVDGIEAPVRYTIDVWAADCRHKRLRLLLSRVFDAQKTLVHVQDKPHDYPIDALSGPPFDFACSGALSPPYSGIKPVPGRIVLDGTIQGLRQSQQSAPPP